MVAPDCVGVSNTYQIVEDDDNQTFFAFTFRMNGKHKMQSVTTKLSMYALFATRYYYIISDKKDANVCVTTGPCIYTA